MLAAVAAIVVVVLVLVLAGGSPYTVKADFVTASQLVKGNAVKVSGHTIGSVGEISLTGDGKARITLNIDGEGYHPLRRGTRATIRQTSLSGVANRYVDLQLGGADGDDIPDGGSLPTESTSAAVDLDQIFNTFDPEARRGVQKSVEFLRDFQAGNEEEANEALRYLNPALSSSARLFEQLDRNTPDFERFITQTARLVTDVSAQDDVLADLTRNLSRTTTALTSNGEALGESIGLLPNVMRKANSTFVNLRSALDDLDPLVDDAKPVVRDKLIPFLDEVRPFARDARPAVRELSRTVRRPGADNDLVELLRRQPALDKIANQTAERNGKDRPGAFPDDDQGLRGDHEAGRVPAALRAGPRRLVRRLLDDRRLRRARQLLARRPAAQRLHRRAAAQRAADPRRAAHADPRRRHAYRAQQPLPGLDRAPRARRLEPLQAVAGLQLRRHAGADRAMSAARRILPRSRALLLLLALAAAATTAGAWLVVTSAGAADDEQRYTVVLDNAFGLTEGSDLRSSGVTIGKVEKLAVQRSTARALATILVTKPSFAGFRSDVFCEVKPQSLIGEYYLDCDPGEKDGPAPDTIPVEQTAGTIPPDVVLDILRRPARERFGLILTELGVGLTGRGEDLNTTLRRAVPALRETDKVLEILAANRRTINALTRDADRALVGVARNRRDVGRFVREAGDTTQASASRVARAEVDRRQAAGLPARAAPDARRARHDRAPADPRAARPAPRRARPHRAAGAPRPVRRFGAAGGARPRARVGHRHRRGHRGALDRQAAARARHRDHRADAQPALRPGGRQRPRPRGRAQPPEPRQRRRLHRPRGAAAVLLRPVAGDQHLRLQGLPAEAQHPAQRVLAVHERADRGRARRPHRALQAVARAQPARRHHGCGLAYGAQQAQERAAGRGEGPGGARRRPPPSRRRPRHHHRRRRRRASSTRATCSTGCCRPTSPTSCRRALRPKNGSSSSSNSSADSERSLLDYLLGP